jgi:hypothetical protein
MEKFLSTLEYFYKPGRAEIYYCARAHTIQFYLDTARPATGIATAARDSGQPGLDFPDLWGIMPAAGGIQFRNAWLRKTATRKKPGKLPRLGSYILFFLNAANQGATVIGTGK